MHSSRIHNACSLTVFCSIRGGGGAREGMHGKEGVRGRREERGRMVGGRLSRGHAWLGGMLGGYPW